MRAVLVVADGCAVRACLHAYTAVAVDRPGLGACGQGMWALVYCVEGYKYSACFMVVLCMRLVVPALACACDCLHVLCLSCACLASACFMLVLCMRLVDLKVFIHIPLSD